MDVIECINKRHSVRSFKDEQVSQETIRELLKLGTMAATGSFMQPWGFVVIQDRDEIEALAVKVKQELLDNLDSTPQLARYKAAIKSDGFNVFNHAPTLIIIYGNTESHMYVSDCTLAAANIMHAAYNMGIGTCWIGFSENYLNTPEFKQKYGVPENFELVSPLTCGYIIEDRPKAERKPPLVFNA